MYNFVILIFPIANITLISVATMQSLGNNQGFWSALVPRNVIQSSMFEEKKSIVQL
jgi:hypothetical protein